MTDLRTYLHWRYGITPCRVHLAVGRDPYLTDTGRYAHRTWEQHSFRYPEELDDIIEFAEAVSDTADLYHCPYGHRTALRRKGGGYDNLLHSDNDGNLDPERVYELGGTVIWSGGSPDNGYGLIPLTETLDNTEHTALNRAYVKAVGADSKFTDENVIRLPGSWNLKPTLRGEPPVQVVWDGRTPHPVDPAKLRAEFGVTTAADWPPTVQRAAAHNTGDRSTDTFRILGVCHTAGMTLAEATDVIMSRDDLRGRLLEMKDGGVTDLLRSWVKLVDAARADDAFFTPPTAEPGPEDTPDGIDYLSKSFTAAELQQRTFVPLMQFIAGIVTEGFGIVAGPPKLGKSWWTLFAALAVSSGGTAFNAIKIGEARPVLLLALEDSPRRLADRIKALWGEDPWPGNLRIQTELTPGDLKPTMVQWLSANPGGLVILDTIGRVRTPKRKGADVYAEDYACGVDLKETVDAYPGSALLGVHHTNKGKHDDFVAELSGSHGLPGAADYILVMKRERGSDEAFLNVTSRDNEEGTYAFRVVNGCLWQLDGGTLAEAKKTAADRKESAGIRKDSNTQKILEFLNEHVGGPVTAKEIGVATGVGRGAVTYLRRLQEKGLVICLPDKPADRWRRA